MALRISAVPLLVSVTMLVAIDGPGFGSDDASAGSLSPIAGLFSVAIFTAATLWMAVAWHRYVLAEEMRGLGPAFHGARMAGWKATSGQMWCFLQLGAMWVVLGWATDTITSALISTNMVIGFVWSVLELWVLSLMGPALLTTLYGHYIEGRPLN